MTSPERVRVGDVLALQRRAVEVDPSNEYEEIGVRSFGRGIFHKDPVRGADLGRKRVFRIEPGDLVISNVFAWEGAIAVASDSETGRIGSHRFMTFVPKDHRIDTPWASWFFRSEPGLELIRRASPGSAGRNRTLAIERFENLEIPLPPLDEQRRIARHLEGIQDFTRAMRALHSEAQARGTALIATAISRLVKHGVTSGWPLRRLDEVSEVNPRRDRLGDDAVPMFVPMAAVDERTGTIASPEQRPTNEIRSGYKQFRQGDVIFARITPCMQNGKSAIFSGPTTHAYGSTEFHVVRPGNEIRAEWIHRFLRTESFRLRAAEFMTGTAGQQRVPSQFLRSVAIPTPTLDEQDQAVAEIDRLADIGRQMLDHRQRATSYVDALTPSVLNQAFAGLR